MRTLNFDPARALLKEGVASRAFPAAAVEVGTDREVLWQEAFGSLYYDSSTPATTPDTIFDLASLTKVLVTTSLAMRLVDDGRISLDEAVAGRIPEWKGRDRESVTIRDLLAHASGLTAWLPLYRDNTGRREYQHAIAMLPLEYAPRTQSIYSDLGFILLGFILEDAAGRSFSDQGTALIRELGIEPLAFQPPASWRERIAPTEIDPWRGRQLVGEVHDENCWALGGAAGHAGLFGSVVAVGQFAKRVLENLTATAAPDTPRLASAATLRLFLTKSDVPGSSRALGWDTMLPTSSCGTQMSPAAFGHTGFTGTSLWIDPVQNAYVALLTNRVHPTRSNEAIRPIRAQLHDAIMGTLKG
ncbi:MAG TPA: serine hydrolase domain-containing protein [Vicinamibacterales bacterium]|jgi:CubicO group peptidase (beta-lactamase class C family)